MSFDSYFRYNETLGSIVGICMLIVLVTGIVDLLAGYKIFRMVLAVKGFFIGAIIGVFTSISEGDSDTILFAALVAGGIVGALSYIFYLIGVFIDCFVISLVALMILFGISESGSSGDFVLLISFIIASVACVLNKQYIILITSIEGATTITAVLCYLFELNRFIGFIVTIVLILVGIQYQNNKQDSEEVYTYVTYKPEPWKPFYLNKDYNRQASGSSNTSKEAPTPNTNVTAPKQASENGNTQAQEATGSEENKGGQA